VLAKALKCISCHSEFPLDALYLCPNCGGILNVIYDLEPLKVKEHLEPEWFLPVESENLVNLGQGNTPLVESERTAGSLGLRKLRLKCEFANPTGSFKDRPVSVGVSKAVEFGCERVIVASTGNGAAAVSAYAAKAGLEAFILVPENTSAEKVKQAAFYGGHVIKVAANSYSECFNLAKTVGEQFGVFNLTTTFINPYTVEGNKLIAHELLEQSGGVPDYIYVPIGAGPLLVGIYKGFVELHRLGRIEKMPRMVGVQAEGCSPIARAFLAGGDEVLPESTPHTVAGGICDGLVGYAQDGTYTLATIKESGGFSLYCDDRQILQAQMWLAEREGIFVEPASAAALAGVARSLEEGWVAEDSDIVAVLTGHGLKDMGAIGRSEGIVRIPNSTQALVDLLERR
jgi:threonine synthase